MAPNISHMEYSMWSQKVVIWSTSYDIRMSPFITNFKAPHPAPEKRHMEYSKWQQFKA